MSFETSISKKDAQAAIFLSYRNTGFLHLTDIDNMITLSQINQYASINGISDDTDIFVILSQMQLEYKEPHKRIIPPAPVDSHIEWTTEEVLALFST